MTKQDGCDGNQGLLRSKCTIVLATASFTGPDVIASCTAISYFIFRL